MATDGLTVAVTGPTGDLGVAIVDALERSRSVRRIIGMARRPFDPVEQGWRKTEYHEGDVQDATGVRSVVRGADVVIHLAFSLMGAGKETRSINVDGSRNVFEAAIAGKAERIVYASSVAAYGFLEENPTWLTEDVPAQGSPEHFYSHQKAEVEAVLAELLMRRRRTTGYVFRPCIVAGPRAQNLLEELPYYKLSDAMPGAVMKLLVQMPALKPVIPDPGTRLQLVHEDDVASAFVAAVQGKGEPGPYNLAARGTITLSDVADALGWYAVSVPGLAVEAAAEVVARLPAGPESLEWIHSVRHPVLLKTDRARTGLGWRPKYTSKATLKELVSARSEEARAGP